MCVCARALQPQPVQMWLQGACRRCALLVWKVRGSLAQGEAGEGGREQATDAFVCLVKDLIVIPSAMGDISRVQREYLYFKKTTLVEWRTDKQARTNKVDMVGDYCSRPGDR